MSGGYLSKDHEHLARLQRQRRARMTRIDYMPGPEALAVIAAKRAKERPGSVTATNSAVIDAIVKEWARLTGKKSPSARASESGGQRPELPRSSRARAGAYESGPTRVASPEFAEHYARARMTSGKADGLLSVPKRAVQPWRRVVCGAKRHRDGQPCQAKSEPGKRRCRFHGGRSTGPRTPKGKARALANLRKGKHQPPLP